MTWQIICGDALTELRKMPDESVHCCVTSPPYYGLRSYSTTPQVWGGAPACEHVWGGEGRSTQRLRNGEGSDTARQACEVTLHPSTGSFCSICGAWRGELGLEPTPQLYVAHMVEVFAEVRRVLHRDGVCFANWGDSYAGSGRGGNPKAGAKQGTNAGSQTVGVLYGRDNASAEAERQYIRQQFVAQREIGLKPKDLVGIPWRCAFALQADGWWLRSDIIWAKGMSFCSAYSGSCMPESVIDRPTKSHEYIFLLTKSKQYFWDQEAVKEPDSGQQHHRNVTAGAPSLEPSGGLRTPHRSLWGTPEKNGAGRNSRSVWAIPTKPYRDAHFAVMPAKLVEPCIKAGCPMGGTVLDPFCGAGTVGLVTERLGRDFIGIELNPGYVEMGKRRIENDVPAKRRVPRRSPCPSQGVLPGM